MYWMANDCLPCPPKHMWIATCSCFCYFHLEVQQGRGAVPINLETPISLCKKQKCAHHGVYVHETGGRLTLSDVDVRIVVVVDTPFKMAMRSINYSKWQWGVLITFLISSAWQYVICSHTCNTLQLKDDINDERCLGLPSWLQSYVLTTKLYMY